MDNVLISVEGAIGRIRLNRPKALNSLTMEMIQAIDAALTAFEAAPEIAAVLITGEGERGLCAGGDIRALYEAGRTRPQLAVAFFRAEYRLNARIARCLKPYIAIMDGITMGGGVGVSAHGQIRIVTERTRLAMPETGIGFFPDIGATWLLTRGPGEIGTYLGLTGAQISAADAIYAGLADFFIPAADLAAMTKAIAALPVGSDGAKINATVAAFATPPEASPLQAGREAIDQAFAGQTMESIMAALTSHNLTFASAIYETLKTKSPISLKVTLAMLRLAKHSDSLEACLEREFVGCHEILRGHDFYEGVRAAVIDKDRNPRWSPSSLAEVSDAAVSVFLRPVKDTLFS